MVNQWRNSDFANVPRRPTAADAGAQVRLFKKCPEKLYAKNYFFVRKPVFKNKNMRQFGVAHEI